MVYRTLKSNGFKCYGIKTDSLFTNASEEQLEKIFKFNKEIGGLKIEKNKVLCTKDSIFENNTYNNNDEKMINKFIIKSEMNFLMIKKHIIKNYVMF